MCGGKERKEGSSDFVSPPTATACGAAAAVEKSIAALVIKGLLVVGTYDLHFYQVNYGHAST